jgi:DNA-binding MarR family transcriptional regulator
VVEAELRAAQLTFTQWLVLEATSTLIEESKDAVNQSAVARRTELDRMTISQVMRTLSERGLVDRAAGDSGPAYRIVLSRKGQLVLRQATARAAAASGLRGGVSR